jgi:hypothetical protein
MSVHEGTVRAAPRPAEGQFWPLLRLSLSAHVIYFVLVAVYYAALVVLVRSQPGTHPTNFLVMALGFVGLSLPVMLFGVALLRFYHLARFVRPEHPIPALIKDMWAFLCDRARMATGLPIVLAMLPFMYVFAEIKANIPVLLPYSWDLTFDEWDRIVHFGTRPWEWLQPVFGYWPVTFLINVNYNLWFAVMWTMWVYFAFSSRPDALRTRFFLTFMLAWAVGGSLLAVVFSSAGPCYLTRLGISPDPYASLMAYLHHIDTIVPVWALDVQDMLWQGHLGRSSIDGISAMPSMHNGTTLLFALAAFKVNRIAGWVLSVHAALIFLGSIHLGWHYAVDSYLAWPLTLAIWFLSAPIARWWQDQGPVKRYLTALDRQANSLS